MKQVRFKLEFTIDDIEQKEITDRIFCNPLGCNREFLRLSIGELCVTHAEYHDTCHNIIDVKLTPNGKLKLNN